MTKIRKIAFIFILLQVVLFAIHAQDMVVKALDLCNKSMILNDYEKAYGYAKFVIEYYENEDMPEDAMTAVKKVLDSRARDLEERGLYDDLLKMEEEIASAPSKVKRTAMACIENARDSIKKAEDDKKRMMEEAKEKEKVAASKAEKDADTEKILKIYEQQAEMTKKQQELQAKRDEQLQQVIADINKNNNDAFTKSASNTMFIVIMFILLILVLIAVVVFVVFLSYKSNKNRQEQMSSTIIAMQAMRLGSGLDALPQYMQSAQVGKPLLLAGAQEEEVPVEYEVQEETEQEQPAEIDDRMKEGLVALINSCKQYGEQIDNATGRKNISHRVADLVYKVSQTLGFDEYKSTLFYAAGLVYDIGFLGIDSSVLKLEKVSNDQFEIIKTHTEVGPNMVFFVPEDIRTIFKDAAGKHHENLDGTGYPMGLEGEEIPYISRVLHVVESYIAQTSRRQYNLNISDRDEAIEQLRSMKEKYDERIIDALDKIV